MHPDEKREKRRYRWEDDPEVDKEHMQKVRAFAGDHFLTKEKLRAVIDVGTGKIQNILDFRKIMKNKKERNIGVHTLRILNIHKVCTPVFSSFLFFTIIGKSSPQWYPGGSAKFVGGRQNPVHVYQPAKRPF